MLSSSSKFPIYITELSPIEEFSERDGLTSKGQAVEFINNQKVDFKNALNYAEQHVACNPNFRKMSAAEIENIILTIHKLLTKTLASQDKNKWLPGQLRTTEVHLVKESSKECEFRKYNLEEPWDIFSLLTAPSNVPGEKDLRLKNATHFIKFFVKWMLAEKTHPMLELLETRSEQCLEHYGYDVKQWRLDYFSGKSFRAWYFEFLDNRGKTLAKGKNKTEESSLCVHRLRIPGVFTPEELEAGSKIIAFFPLASELPERMKAFTHKLVEMMQSNEDPIKTASYAHQEICTYSHFYINRNGLSSRILMNGILLNYGLPAIQLEPDQATKQQHYVVIESNLDKPEAFENYIREKVQAQQQRNAVTPTAFNLCLAAQKGDLTLATMLLEAGVKVNECPENTKKNTALHYACAYGKFQVAMYLISHGANAAMINEAGKTPVQSIKKAALENPDTIWQIKLMLELIEKYQQPDKSPSKKPSSKR